MAKKGISKRFIEKIDKIFNDADSDIKLLESLATLLRQYDSIKVRNEGYSKYLKDKIRPLMKKLNIKEYQFRRTFIRLDEIWSIPPDDRGREIIEKLINVIGEDNVKKWVVVEEEFIPAHTKKNYRIPEEVRKEIEESSFSKDILSILGNTPRIVIGPIPKRVKRGKSRKKR